MRSLSSPNSFLDSFRGPKAAKIDQKSSSEDVKNEKVKMLIFDTPPLQNLWFWVPIEVKWGVKSISIAIENDNAKTMLYREGVES